MQACSMESWTVWRCTAHIRARGHTEGASAVRPFVYKVAMHTESRRRQSSSLLSETARCPIVIVWGRADARHSTFLNSLGRGSFASRIIVPGFQLPLFLFFLWRGSLSCVRLCLIWGVKNFAFFLSFDY